MSKNFYNLGLDINTSCGGGMVNNCSASYNEYIIGNSVDFTVEKCDSEIKADITVSYRDSVRVWGQILDCDGNPVPYAYLKLIKCSKNGYQGIAHTISDCLGFYQFDICPCNDGVDFKILVGKASSGGPERIISTGIAGSKCNPCNGSDFPQCDCK